MWRIRHIGNTKPAGQEQKLYWTHRRKTGQKLESKVKSKEEFAEKHRSQIVLFEAALKQLQGAEFPPIKELRQSYSALMLEKENLYAEYKKQKSKTAEMDIVKSNIEAILGASHKPSPEKSAAQ